MLGTALRLSPSRAMDRIFPWLHLQQSTGAIDVFHISWLVQSKGLSFNDGQYNHYTFERYNHPCTSIQDVANFSNSCHVIVALRIVWTDVYVCFELHPRQTRHPGVLCPARSLPNSYWIWLSRVRRQVDAHRRQRWKSNRYLHSLGIRPLLRECDVAESLDEAHFDVK